MTVVFKKTEISKLLKYFSSKYLVVDFRKESNVLPVKKFFFPPKDYLFTYVRKKKNIKELLPQKKKLLIFGLNLKDIEALDYLDEIMTKPLPDFFYLQKRKNSVIIGVIEHSLAESLGKVGCDLILEKINRSQYQVIPLSRIGKIIIKNDFFKEVSDEKLKIIHYTPPKSNFQEMLRDSEFLAEVISWSRNHPLWDKLAQICLGCGICSYVCPLCYCFSTEDEVENKYVSYRCRYWDSCILSDFSKISGGHNFRPTLKGRYYNWFYHKFVRAYKEFGRAQCVGCGRCQKYCPAKIDIEKIFQELIKDYQNQVKNEKSLSSPNSKNRKN